MSEPWEGLGTYTKAGPLRKMARMLSALAVNSEGQTTDPIFGLAGVAIANEVDAYCDHIEARQQNGKTRRETKAKKEESKDLSWETTFLARFYAASEDLLGVADKNYGRDRRLIRRLSDTVTPEQLTELIDVFFSCSTDKPYLFGTGNVLQFTRCWIRLQAEKKSDGDETGSVVPESLTG